MKTTKPTTPLFKDMTDEGLVEAYHGVRNAIALADRMASAPSATRAGRNLQARNVGRGLRHLDIIVAIGRKRGIGFFFGRADAAQAAV